MKKNKFVAAALFILLSGAVLYGLDFTPVEHSAPEEYEYGQFIPEAYFVEQEGSASGAGFIGCHCLIETMDGNSVQHDSVFMPPYNAYDSLWIAFPPAEGFPADTYQVTFFAMGPSGTDTISKPPLVAEFYYEIYPGADEESEHQAINLDVVQIDNNVTISFNLPRFEHVELSVYDASGSRVAGLASGPLCKDRYELDWNISEVPQGIYIIRLETGESRVSRKVVVLK